MTHIYGPDGEYKGSVSDVGPQDTENAKTVFTLAILGGIGWWLWNILHNWQKLEAPFNYIAGYYYHLIIVPLKQIPLIWSGVSNSAITSYSNLNMVLAGLSVLLYVFLAFPLVVIIVNEILKLLKIEKYWRTIVFSPAVFALFWFVFSAIFSWLFAK